MKKIYISLIVVLFAFPLLFINKVNASWVDDGMYKKQSITLHHSLSESEINISGENNIEYSTNGNTFESLNKFNIKVYFYFLPTQEKMQIWFFDSSGNELKRIEANENTVLTLRYFDRGNVDDTGVLTSFNHLPKTKTNQKIKVYLDKERDRYVLTFDADFGSISNVLKVSNLPHHSLEDFKRKDDDIERIEYFTNEDGERILFYEFTDKADLRNDRELGFQGFQPFVYYNITTEEVNGTDSLFLPGVTFAEGDNAYMDVLFPMALDDLLEMNFNYTYQYQTGILGIGISWSKEETKTVSRLKDAKEAKLAWWQSMLKATLDPAQITFMGGWIDLYRHDRKDAEHITNINHMITTDYKNKYVNKINEEYKNRGEKARIDSSVFGNNNSLYRIYIDNMYRWSSTRFRINDVSFMNIKYVFEGKHYSVYEEDIESIVTQLVGKSSAENFLDSIKEFIDWISKHTSTLIKFFIGIAALILLGPVVTLITLLFKSLKLILSTVLKIPGLIINTLRMLFVPTQKKKKKNERKRY